MLPHRELLQSVWGPDYGDQVDYLRVFVNQLRKKIEAKPSSPTYLLTEPWAGYGSIFRPTSSTAPGSVTTLEGDFSASCHFARCIPDIGGFPQRGRRKPADSAASSVRRGPGGVEGKSDATAL